MSCGRWSMSKDENMHSLIPWKHVLHPATFSLQGYAFLSELCFRPLLARVSRVLQGARGWSVRGTLGARADMCMLEAEIMWWQRQRMCSSYNDIWSLTSRGIGCYAKCGPTGFPSAAGTTSGFLFFESIWRWKWDVGNEEQTVLAL